MPICRFCGVELNGYEVACPSCHSVLVEPNKDKTVTALLAFFFGGLGLHRFYLGQWYGLFYLILSWTFIPSLIGIIEGVVLFTKSDVAWALEHSPRRQHNFTKDTFNRDTKSLSSKTKSQEQRECPFCAELIKAKAIKCKHCGAEVTPQQADR